MRAFSGLAYGPIDVHIQGPREAATSSHMSWTSEIPARTPIALRQIASTTSITSNCKLYNEPRCSPFIAVDFSHFIA